MPGTNHGTQLLALHVRGNRLEVPISCDRVSLMTAIGHEVHALEHDSFNAAPAMTTGIRNGYPHRSPSSSLRMMNHTLTAKAASADHVLCASPSACLETSAVRLGLTHLTGRDDDVYTCEEAGKATVRTSPERRPARSVDGPSGPRRTA